MVHESQEERSHPDHRIGPRVSKLFVMVVGILALGLSGCPTPKITSQVMVPAKSHEASKMRRIAVLPFSGQEGEQMSSDVEALLVRTQVQGAPYFTVIERTALRKVTTEQALQLSGAIDEKTAVTVGKLVGAEGIVLGTVTANTIEDKPYSETRSRCSAQDSKGKCTSWQNYTVSCTKRDAYFSFTPKILSVATGQIVVSEILTGQNSEQVCQDAQQPLKGRVEMLTAAKGGALQKFRELIAPYYVTRVLKILEKDDTKPPEAAREALARGVQWAKEGRLDRACELWQDAYNLHPQGYAVHYDLGLCAEMAGKLPEALAYYEKADRLTGKPVGEISEALGRVRVSMTRQQQLEEQIKRK